MDILKNILVKTVTHNEDSKFWKGTYTIIKILNLFEKQLILSCTHIQRNKVADLSTLSLAVFFRSYSKTYLDVRKINTIFLEIQK